MSGAIEKAPETGPSQLNAETIRAGQFIRCSQARCSGEVLKVRWQTPSLQKQYCQAGLPFQKANNKLMREILSTMLALVDRDCSRDCVCQSLVIQDRTTQSHNLRGRAID